MQRDLQFDIVRVLATLWIVAAWHALDYLKLSNIIEIQSNIGFITTYVLATFMFMSGYFLSKYTFSSGKEILLFYKKRLTRFFPLFFFSALLLYRLGYNSDGTCFVFTLTGLASYVGCPPMTIWFISLLFSFYMLTPLVSKGLAEFKDNVIFKLVIVTTSSIMFVYLLSLISPNYDQRISYTLPFYWIGLVVGNSSLIKLVTSKWYTLLISSIVLITFRFFGIFGEGYLHIDVIIGIIVFLSACYWIKFLPVSKIIQVLSYASMCMYLFHRPIYHLVLKYIIHDVKIVPYLFFLILFPIVVVLSYAIQFGYDKFIKKIGL